MFPLHSTPHLYPDTSLLSSSLTHGTFPLSVRQALCFCITFCNPTALPRSQFLAVSHRKSSTVPALKYISHPYSISLHTYHRERLRPSHLVLQHYHAPWASVKSTLCVRVLLRHRHGLWHLQVFVSVSNPVRYLPVRGVLVLKTVSRNCWSRVPDRLFRGVMAPSNPFTLPLTLVTYSSTLSSRISFTSWLRPYPPLLSAISHIILPTFTRAAHHCTLNVAYRLSALSPCPQLALHHGRMKLKQPTRYHVCQRILLSHPCFCTYVTVSCAYAVSIFTILDLWRREYYRPYTSPPSPTPLSLSASERRLLLPLSA